MADSRILEFFKNGGVFYFNEENSASENTFYKVEDLMGEEEGMNITETEVDEEGCICVFYDSSVIDDETAKTKYNNGEYSVSI